MSNTRYFMGISYPENMIPTWREDAEDIIEVAAAYAIHDADEILDPRFRDDPFYGRRKDHVHWFLAFTNTTTSNHAKSIINRLSISKDRPCCSTIMPIANTLKAYEYLIHENDSAKKAGKHLYPVESRIELNNFDIGFYVQISQDEKDTVLGHIRRAIFDSVNTDNPLLNFGLVAKYLEDQGLCEYDIEFQVLKGYKGLICEYCKYVYFKLQKQEESKVLELYSKLKTDNAMLEASVNNLNIIIDKLCKKLNYDNVSDFLNERK